MTLPNKEIAERLRGLDDVSPDLCRLAAERLIDDEGGMRGLRVALDTTKARARYWKARALTDSDRQRLREIADRIASEIDPELYGNDEARAAIAFLRDLASRGEGE